MRLWPDFTFLYDDVFSDKTLVSWKASNDICAFVDILQVRTWQVLFCRFIQAHSLNYCNHKNNLIYQLSIIELVKMSKWNTISDNTEYHKPLTVSPQSDLMTPWLNKSVREVRNNASDHWLVCTCIIRAYMYSNTIYRGLLNNATNQIWILKTMTGCVLFSRNPTRGHISSIILQV